MGPRQAWGALSLVFILVDLAAAALLIDLGYDMYLVLASAAVVALVYLYVLYKRYHVEVVPENDIMLFDDPDDLRILCRIYGLNDMGEAGALRQRLLRFAKENRERAFAWVAPKAVLSFGSALEAHQVPAPKPRARQAPGLIKELVTQTKPTGKGLLGGRTRSSARLSGISVCPICDSKLPRTGAVCPECGADLEFYAVLQETKIGKRMLSAKASAVRRKLRYEVLPLEGAR